MRKTTFVQQPIVVGLALGLLVVLAGCSTNTPTAPAAKPTPTAYSISLASSSSRAVGSDQITFVAKVTSGGSNVADGTSVTFRLADISASVVCPAGGANPGSPVWVFENGQVQVTKTTSGGSASTFLSAPCPYAAQGSFSVSASAGSASVKVGVTWYPAVAAGGPPVLYQVIPNTGPVLGGQQIRLIGGALSGSVSSGSVWVASVKFSFTVGGASVTRDAVVVSAAPDGTELDIVTPTASPNPVTVSAIDVDFVVTNNAGTTTFPKVFTYKSSVGPPLAFNVSPSQGSCAGGDTVTIYGSGLVGPANVVFSPGGQAQVRSVASDGTNIVVTTPSYAPCTAANNLTQADVTITTQFGTDHSQQVTISKGFTWLATNLQPTLYALSPSSGPIDGGTRVTITGAGFQYPVQVFFGDHQAQVASVNEQQVIAISPSLSPSQPATPTTVQVKVVNITDGLVSTNTLPFRYGEAMFISSIAPAIGPDTGGTQFTIFGQGFVAPVSVSLAGWAASVTSVSGTEIAGVSGGVLQSSRSCSPITGTVSVTNINSNISATGAGWTYTPAQPLITSVTVSGCTGASGNSVPGNSAGCTITVNGSGFEPNEQLSFTNPKITLPETSGTSTQASFTLTSSLENLGIKYNTTACTNGTQNLTTPIDVTIFDPANKCTNTLTGGLLVVPSDTTCHVTAPLTLTLLPATASIAGGTTFTYTVNFSRPAQASDGTTLVVNIAPSGSGVIATASPIVIAVAPGDTFKTFGVTAGTTAGTATITATYGGASATANLTVTTAVTGVVFTPNALTLAPGGSSTIGISLNPAAATPTTVTVTLIGPSGVIVSPAFPQTVTVPAGGTGTLSITAGATAGSVTLQGSATGYTTGTATVTVSAPAVTLSLTPTSQTLAPTQSASLNVTITPPPSAPATVNLSLAGPSGVLASPTFPTTVTVPVSGTYSLPITAGTTNGTITITGTYGSATASATVTVQTTPLTLTMAPSSQTLAVGGTANFIVSINQAQPVPVTVYITQNGPTGVISITGTSGSPPAVTIPANQSFTNFTVTGVTVGGPVTITGTLPPGYGGGTANSTVTVNNFILTLSPNPISLGVGATTNMSVSLNNPAPATTTVNLTSAAPAIATVPASVTIAAGATSATAVVTGVAPGTTTITAGPVASLGGAQATTTVNVAPYTFTLSPNPMTLAPGATATLTATLNNPAASGHTTQLVIGAVPPGIATLGTNTLVFPAGTATATTVVTAVGPGTATVTAQLQIDAVTVSSSNWTITTVSALTISANPSSIAGWQGGLFTVQLTLNAPAPAAITVPLTITGPQGVITVSPNPVTFAAGATTAQYTISANQVSPSSTPDNVVATLPGQYGGGQTSTSITVALPLTFTPASVTGPVGFVSNIIVTMAAAQPTPTVVTLTEAGTPGFITFPPTVTIPANTTFTTFTITGNIPQNPGYLVATLPPTLPQGLGGATATLTVTVTGAYVISLTPNPMTLAIGTSTNMTLNLNFPAPATTVVPLASADPSIATVPASVTLAMGTTTVTFVVTAVAPGTTTVTAGPVASLNNAQASATVQVLPAYTISLSPNPVSLTMVTTPTAVLTVTLNQAAPSAGGTVTLSSANTGIATVSPTTLSFGPGATMATALVTAVAAGTTVINATGSVSLNGATSQTTVNVAAAPPPTPTPTPTPPTLAISPLNPTLSAATLPQTITFQVTVTPGQAVTVNLNYSGNTSIFGSMPATVTTNGSGIGTFSITINGASGQSGTITASYDGSTPVSTTVTIGP